MTQSPTDSAATLWSVPECPFQIEASPRVLDDIRLTVMDAFFSLPRGGAEIGGILLGSYDSGRLAITGYAALDCEHAFGPSFTLSTPDEVRLQALLASHINGPADRRTVGWYHSHTRSAISLSDADVQIHKRYFPEPWQVALVIKPHTFQPAKMGFFFQEASGSMRTQDSYREFALEALPLGQVPNGVPSAAPAAEVTVRRYQKEPIPAGQAIAVQPLPPANPPKPVPERDPHPAAESPVEPVAGPSRELPVPQFLSTAPPPSRRWMWALVALGIGLGIGAAGFQTRHSWLPKVTAAVNPATHASSTTPALGLTTIDRDGQLQINWDRNSRAVLQARDAILEITDGATPARAIQLDRTHLQTGSFTYARQADKVDLKLIVHPASGPDIREVSSFLGKLPERKPAEDPGVVKQRDELAKQAAELKTDLSAQAEKTKKLEKDLKSIREEMKQQQMKRLANQLADK